MTVVEPTSKAQEAYQRIRDLLSSGEISGDKPLTELALTEMTGINRGPVRESLLRLHGEGRIRFRGHRRGRVIEFLEDQDKEQLLKRYEMREFIVAGAARLAALNMTGRQIEELRRLARAAGDSRAGFAAHARAMWKFWDILMANCGNELLYDAWDRYNLKPPTPRNADLERRILNQIPPAARRRYSLLKIVDAIASHDVDLAEKTVRRGVRAITEALRKTDWEIE